MAVVTRLSDAQKAGRALRIARLNELLRFPNLGVVVCNMQYPLLGEEYFSENSQKGVRVFKSDETKLLSLLLKKQERLIKWLAQYDVPFVFAEKKGCGESHYELLDAANGVGGRKRFEYDGNSVLGGKTNPLREPLSSMLGQDRKTLILMGVNVQDFRLDARVGKFCLEEGPVMKSMKDLLGAGFEPVYVDDLCGNVRYLNRKEKGFFQLPNDGLLPEAEVLSSDVYMASCSLVRLNLTGAHFFHGVDRLAKRLGRANNVEPLAPMGEIVQTQEEEDNPETPSEAPVEESTKLFLDFNAYFKSTLENQEKGWASMAQFFSTTGR